MRSTSATPERPEVRTQVRTAQWAVGVGVVAISFAAIFFRETAPTHPLVAAGLRLAIAAVLLSPKTLRALASGTLPRRVLGPAALAGLLYALHFGSWVSSLMLTSVAASVTLVTATPLLLAVLALATRRDRATRREWSAMAIATAGVIIIGSDARGANALLGDALALLGAVAMAMYLLVVRRLGAVDAWAFIGVACAVGAVVLLGTALVIGVSLVPASPRAMLFVLLAALLPQLVGHGLLTWSLRHLSPTSVGLATVGEPVLSTAIAWWWLSEHPSTWTMVGCAVTLLGVGLSFRGR